MKIKILQIRDIKKTDYAFMDYEYACSHGFTIDDYEMVFDGEVDGELDDIFRIFNVEPPSGFKGWSLSVSDLVWTGKELMYCDRIGWKTVLSESEAIRIWYGNEDRCVKFEDIAYLMNIEESLVRLVYHWLGNKTLTVHSDIKELQLSMFCRHLLNNNGVYLVGYFAIMIKEEQIRSWEISQKHKDELLSALEVAKSVLKRARADWKGENRE